jgi:transcriptional regulator with XRE-family HTH domain
MATRSPTELLLKNAPPEASAPAGLAEVTWEARASFGPYLRGLREARRLSLRAASDETGISFSYLAKLETGERLSAPSLKVLQRIARFYGRDLREIMHEAGFRFELPSEIEAQIESLDAQFLRLVTHPALRPMRMDAVVMEMIPPLAKRQWIEFARRLEAHLIGDSETVDAIVARPASEAPATTPSPPPATPTGTRRKKL